MYEREKAIFHQVENVVRQTMYSVPRNHQTIGGMWTVDTYKKGDITVQLMDEGYTTRIFTDSIEAVETGLVFKVIKGTLEDFENLLKCI